MLHWLAILNILLGVYITSDWIYQTDVDPESFVLQNIPPFQGALSPNNKLTNVEKMFSGKIRGPESMGVYKGKIYSGLSDGRIVEMDPINQQVKTIVSSFGKPPCGNIVNEPTCGRPLGIRIKNGFLYSVDAYLGIFKTDIETGETKQLLSADVIPPDGRQTRFLNDIEVTSNGDIYITDSSYKWTRADHCYVGFENRPYARLIKFNPRNNTTEVIMQDMYFANGLQLSPDESYILTTEMSRSRVTRYFLSGPHEGESDIFADNLPGLPDNIRPSSSGGYWVAFAVVRHPDLFSVWDTLSNKPWIRRQMAKIFHKNTIGQMVPRYCLAVELDSTGKIIQSIHDPEGKVMTAISEVLECNKSLYIGSYFMPFLGKVKQE